MWSIAKSTGRPIHPQLPDMHEWPHTITACVTLRARYDSYQEFSEPIPQEYWDFPHLVRQHIEKLYPSSAKKSSHEVDVDIED